MDLIKVQGKNFVVTGVANSRSIAWGMAKVLDRAGANLLFTYRKERSKDKLIQLLDKEMPNQKRLISCDVLSDASIQNAMKEIESIFPVVHGLIHSVAFADKEELQGQYVNTTREGYQLAQDSSAYSLVALARGIKPLMTEGGSIVTLTYLGGERVVKNYNVMGVAKAALEASVKYLANDLGSSGIRVNAISAGPIRTLAAKGVSGFNELVKDIEERSPLRRTVTQEECGKTGLFLLSDLSSGITGENIHLDSGFHILGF